MTEAMSVVGQKLAVGSSVATSVGANNGSERLHCLIADA